MLSGIVINISINCILYISERVEEWKSGRSYEKQGVFLK